MNQRNRGSVLIITLLVLFFLSATALSLAYFMRLEISVVKRQIDRLRSFYIARGGLSLILEALRKDKLKNEFDYPNEDWRRGFQDGGRPKDMELPGINGAGGGTYRVSVSDEAGRININKASAQTLERLLGNFKGIDSKKAARQILAYVKDKHPDNKFYSIYELLELKEIKREIFWGEDTNENAILDSWEDDGDKSPPADNQDGELTPGLKDLLTVHTDGKININSAPFLVLISMPGMSKETADILIEARDKEPFKSLDDLKKLSLIPDEVFAQLAGWATVESNQFRIYIAARASDSKIGREVLAVVDRSDESPRIRYWRED